MDITHVFGTSGQGSNPCETAKILVIKNLILNNLIVVFI